MQKGIVITGNCPPDIKKIVLEKQSDMKIGCNCMVSLETALYKIVKEWREMREEQKSAEIRKSFK